MSEMKQDSKEDHGTEFFDRIHLESTSPNARGAALTFRCIGFLSPPSCTGVYEIAEKFRLRQTGIPSSKGWSRKSVIISAIYAPWKPA